MKSTGHCCKPEILLGTLMILEQIERYQAEALILDHLPIEALLGIVCYTKRRKNNA